MVNFNKIKTIVFLLCLLSSFILTKDGRVIYAYAAEDKDGLLTSFSSDVFKCASKGNDKTADDGAKQSGEDGVSDDTESTASDVGISTKLYIDNNNIYKGMKTSFCKGYIPTVTGKNVQIVIPLISNNKLKGNKLRASLKLGESENIPFVYKNYEKNVRAGYHKTNKGAKKCYLVNFNLELKGKRYNGTYPVTVTVTATDKQGNEVYQDFVVYVTISNGIDTSSEAREASGDTQVRYAPKVMIRSCKFSKNKIICGEKFTANIILYNTSKTSSVKNMTVKVQPGENVELLSKTGSSFVRSLGAGKSCKVSFVFRVREEAPYGQYNIDVNLDYADSRGNTYTVDEAVKVLASQKPRIEILPVTVPKSMVLGETANLQAQVMNLGKGRLYHVRAVLEGDGLSPSGHAFIGDMEGGTESTGEIEVTAEGLSGDTLYGMTEGTITFYYEDEMGNEMMEKQSFETSILSPLSEPSSDEESVGDNRQWWVIMAVILIIIFHTVIIFVVKKSKEARMGEGSQYET